MRLWIAVAALCVALAGAVSFGMRERQERVLAEARFEAAAEAVREAVQAQEKRLKADASVRSEKRVQAQDIRRRTDAARKELGRSGPDGAEYVRLRNEAIATANAAIERASRVP